MNVHISVDSFLGSEVSVSDLDASRSQGLEFGG
jgi:hypothetical protein